MPGLLALVDVMGSPCASMSRAKDPCGVHLTATPPSGPRNRSGTRFSPPGSTRVNGPGQNRAASIDAYPVRCNPSRVIISLLATSSRKGFPGARPLSMTSC